MYKVEDYNLLHTTHPIIYFLLKPVAAIHFCRASDISSMRFYFD